MNTNNKNVSGKKRGRAAAPPDQKRNHQIPVALDGHEKAKLSELLRRARAQVAALGMPFNITESSMFRAFLAKAWEDLIAKEGPIVVLPEIKVASESSPESSPESSTGTDD